jgi:hypothetical protein
MHKKYAGDGFVAMSVSLDNAKDKEIRVEVDAFLTKNQADFTNVILEAPMEEWQEKLKIDSYPCVFIFNRDNRIVRKLVGEQVDYKAIEAEVVKLLKK